MADFKKIAMACICLAFELILVCTAVTNLSGGSLANNDERDAIRAFLILGYLTALVAFTFVLLMNYAGISGKIFNILTIILAIATPVMLLIGLSIDGSTRVSSSGQSYTYAVYSVGGILSVIGGICLVLGK